MPADTVPVQVRSQISRLTLADEKRLVSIIDDFSVVLEEVRRINTGTAPVSEWGLVRRRLLASLAQMQSLIETHPVLESFAKYGPDAAGAGYCGFGAPGPEAWLSEVDQRHKLALEWLDCLKHEIKAQRAGRRLVRRRRAPRQPTELTETQIEAVHLVGEHRGNIAAAANAAGKSRQAMGKLYKKAMQKLGKKAVEKVRTRPLPTDRRGQIDVADDKAPDPTAVE
jgi:hypothetical protein